MVLWAGKFITFNVAWTIKNSTQMLTKHNLKQKLAERLINLESIMHKQHPKSKGEKRLTKASDFCCPPPLYLDFDNTCKRFI